MRAEILKEILRAHLDRDDPRFRSAALKLVSNEHAAGHVRIAEELREIIESLDLADPVPSGPQQVVDIGRPRRELSGLLQGGHRRERFRDVILNEASRKKVERVLRETKLRSDLLGWNVEPSRRLLFYGPPGCGKTLTAQVIAGELGLPLMTVKLDSLFSRYLGETANHLNLIFEEMPRRPAVYLFDEFDAIARTRAETHDVGELKRVVISFLQLMDSDSSPSVIIAATNFDRALDQAVFRRFDALIRFPLPDHDEIVELIQLRLAAFSLSATTIASAARKAHGISFADVSRACNDAIKTMALDKRTKLRPADLIAAISAAAERGAEGTIATS